MRLFAKKVAFKSAHEAFWLAGRGTRALTQASPIRRVSAFILDCILLLPLWGVAIPIYKRMALYQGGVSDGLAWYDALATSFAKWPGLIPGLLVASFTTFVLVRALVTLVFGRTPGLALAGVRLVRGDLSEVRPAVVLLREGVALLSFMALGGGYLWAIFDEAWRPWHDKMSGTYCVRDEL